jgi:hypothetical protein
MSDVVARMKEELRLLDCRIQAERNDEVRHGLQRGRLEAERAQLLLKIMETMQLVSPTAFAAPYRVVMQGTETAVRAVIGAQPIEAIIPMRLPTLSMIKDALQSAPDGLLPNQIIKAVRTRGSQSKPTMVYRAVNRLLKAGRIGRVDRRYSVSRSNGAHP